MRREEETAVFLDESVDGKQRSFDLQVQFAMPELVAQPARTCYRVQMTSDTKKEKMAIRDGALTI